MAFNINDFRSSGLTLGGARPSLFEIQIASWPGASADVPPQLSFLAKASQVPPSVIGQVEIPYFGRRIKLVGDRVYTNWNVTVMNDEDYKIRNAMEEWHNLLNQHIENNMTLTGGPNPSSYKRNIIVKHFGKTGNTIKTYTMVGVFPVTLSEMALDWEATDQVQQFDVEFALDYWLPFEDIGNNG